MFSSGDKNNAGAPIMTGAPFSLAETDIGILDYILRALYDRECRAFAMKLIERFGSFGGVFGATREELMTVDGMTERAAAFFAFARPLLRQCVLRSTAVKPKIDSECALAMYAVAVADEKKRRGYCLLSDARSHVFRTFGIGEDPVRAIVGGACRSGAKKAAWLSCKPTGSAAPDVERLFDIAKTVRALAAVDIEFVEYVEYSESGFFFLRRAVSGASDGSGAAACDDKYSPVPRFATLIEEYAEKLSAQKRKLFLN